MKNNDARLLKLENDFQQITDENEPCYIFSYKWKSIVADEIIAEIKELTGRAITKAEFKRWKKDWDESNKQWLICSPNYTIEKLINQTEKGERCCNE